MLLKFTSVTAKPQLQANQVWSDIAAYFRQQRERTLDRRILMHMNDHALRDLGLDRSQNRLSRHE